MELRHLTGSTYYIDSPSITGVYLFTDQTCLLIDSGANVDQSKQIVKILTGEGWTPCGIINTHGHADHCGGNNLIQKLFHCRIYTSAFEAALISNPLLIAYTLFSACPPPPLINKYLLADPSVVTDVIEPGKILINETAFQIINLKGHTLGQIGIVTPDNIAFLGDSLIDHHILADFNFLYLVDVKAQLETLQLLQTAKFSCALLSHGGCIEDLEATIQQNHDLLDNISKLIVADLKTPCSREEILTQIVNTCGLPVNMIQYYFMLATISAFLSYLYTNKWVKARTIRGIIKFSATGG